MCSTRHEQNLFSHPRLQTNTLGFVGRPLPFLPSHALLASSLDSVPAFRSGGDSGGVLLFHIPVSWSICYPLEAADRKSVV